MDITIVFTDENDERFQGLVRELDRGYFERIGDGLMKYKEYNEFKKPHIVVLALEGDEAVACASYRKFDNDSVEFKRVFVKRQYQRKGIAYCLMRKLERLATDDGFKHSYIVTGKNNSAAINLYEKMNYQIIDNFGEFKDDNVVICMKKEFRL